jgi:hypothetical protein
MSSSLDTKALTKAAGIGAGVGAILALGALIPCVGIVCCGLLLVLGAAAGASYGYFTRQNNMPLDGGMGALGGGIAGLASGLGYSVVSGIATALLTLLGVGLAASTATYEQYGLPPELATSVGTSIGGILMVSCIALVVASILGAVGGLVYSLATANQPASPLPPPAV